MREHPDEAHPDEAHLDERYPDEAHPDEAHPDEAHPGVMFFSMCASSFFLLFFCVCACFLLL